MRRSAELECVDDEAELIFSLLLADAQNLEHPLLHLGVVDSDRAATEFGAVQHKIVGIGTDLLQILFPIAVEQIHVLRLRRGERIA